MKAFEERWNWSRDGTRHDSILENLSPLPLCCIYANQSRGTMPAHQSARSLSKVQNNRSPAATWIMPMINEKRISLLSWPAGISSLCVRMWEYMHASTRIRCPSLSLHSRHIQDYTQEWLLSCFNTSKSPTGDSRICQTTSPWNPTVKAPALPIASYWLFVDRDNSWSIVKPPFSCQGYPPSEEFSSQFKRERKDVKLCLFLEWTISPTPSLA